MNICTVIVFLCSNESVNHMVEYQAGSSLDRQDREPFTSTGFVEDFRFPSLQAAAEDQSSMNGAPWEMTGLVWKSATPNLMVNI